MQRAIRFCLLTSTSYFITIGVAWAGTITAQGAVTALDDINQMQGIVGIANYNEADDGAVPLDLYSAVGMTFHTGPLVDILPGVTTGGSASAPIYMPFSAQNFPVPIAGGGVHEGSFTYYGGAVTFDQPITQLGLTAARNGTQYLTVWDTNGNMIGQVTWVPSNDSAFIGIDTNGVPIGMATYGNDNLWTGASYGIGGSTIMSDTWVWASGTPCQSDSDCIDDGNPCTAAPVCQSGVCVHTPDDNGVCPDDGESCTFDICQNGACVHPNNPDGECPDDGNQCTDDVCIDGVCSHPNNTDPCDDGNACTDNDQCSNGECDGDILSCADDNLCTMDSCDMQLGCTYDWTPGCCTASEDCDEGYICHFGSNSCIVDPDPTGDGDGDGDPTTGDGDGDGDPTTGDGDGDGDPTTGDGDGDGDPATGDGESESDAGESESDVGESDGGVPFDTFGADSVDDGCSCSTEERGTGALFGLFGLALLGAVRRRKN